MAVSKRRKKGLEHLRNHRAMRMAAKKGEQVDALREMMEISKMYANHESGTVDTAKFEVTELDSTGNTLTQPVVSDFPYTPAVTVVAQSIPDDAVLEGDIVS